MTYSHRPMDVAVSFPYGTWRLFKSSMVFGLIIQRSLTYFIDANYVKSMRTFANPF
jgi:hypothetical protein